MQYPSYLDLSQEELKNRCDVMLEGLKNCKVCPRHCQVDRTVNRIGECCTGRQAMVASAQLHFGEEPEISGRNGSGTIFFTYCNLHCQFCQNYDISQQGYGTPVTPEELAAMMLKLQRSGAHNINLVTPSHVIPQILEAISLAIPKGLRLPLVYNSGGYDDLQTLLLLEGIIDIYMPDFKTLSPQFARDYLKAEDYPLVVIQALLEMHRQTGLLKTSESGVAQRGLLIRHLVMPGNLEDTAQILHWIADRLSPRTSVNVMGQYHPAYRAGQHPHLLASLTVKEHRRAMELKRRILSPSFEKLK